MSGDVNFTPVPEDREQVQLGGPPEAIARPIVRYSGAPECPHCGRQVYGTQRGQTVPSDVVEADPPAVWGYYCPLCDLMIAPGPDDDRLETPGLETNNDGWRPVPADIGSGEGRVFVPAEAAQSGGER